MRVGRFLSCLWYTKHIMKNVKQAFTIVELLIVVMVIAILAAITIVAYNGVTNNAKEASLKSDLKTAASDLELVNLKNTSYPDNPTLKKSGDNVLVYSGGGATFCITATNPSLQGKAFYTTQNGSIESGACPVAPTNGATMQSVTQSQCQALPVYTGANSAALRTLTDNRGGTTRSYTIAKLVDNKCWMLDNLKLGSTTNSITLTPSDSNVAGSFTLPQLITTRTIDTSTNPGNDYDTPYAYGPVPGDTSAGPTNYGYLYNFSAATAGATRTSLPAGNDAQSSICPVNWRLPSGGDWNAATNEFSNLNAGMAGLSGVTDVGYTSSNYTGPTFAANWQNNGPFKGVFSSYWWYSFAYQGSYAYLWSRSTYAPGVNSAHNALFGASSVSPGTFNGRLNGHGVRCLLN